MRQRHLHGKQQVESKGMQGPGASWQAAMLHTGGNGLTHGDRWGNCGMQWALGLKCAPREKQQPGGAGMQGPRGTHIMRWL